MARNHEPTARIIISASSPRIITELTVPEPFRNLPCVSLGTKRTKRLAGVFVRNDLQRPASLRDKPNKYFRKSNERHNNNEDAGNTSEPRPTTTTPRTTSYLADVAHFYNLSREVISVLFVRVVTVLQLKGKLTYWLRFN